MDGLDQGRLHGGGVSGYKANCLAGSLDRSIIHAEDVMDRVIHNAQEAEQNQESQQHGQAAAHGVIAMLLLELHQLLLLFLRIVFVFLLDLVDQGLEYRHLSRGFLLVDRQREKQQLHDDGGDDDRHCVVADEAVQHLHQRANQDGQEVHKVHTLSILPRLRPGPFYFLCRSLPRRAKT